MKRLIILTTLGLLVIITAGIILQNGFNNPPNNNSNNQESAADNENFTLENIANHNKETDCYLAINNKVYNVTDFIPTHPGGQAILQGCGTDATTLFETRPMGSKTPHSQNARDLLQLYYIGDLAN